jgi:hypothetical protein
VAGTTFRPTPTYTTLRDVIDSIRSASIDISVTATRRALQIFNPTPRRKRAPSGQAKVNMLFHPVQRRLVNRSSVETVAKAEGSNEAGP